MKCEAGSTEREPEAPEHLAFIDGVIAQLSAEVRDSESVVEMRVYSSEAAVVTCVDLTGDEAKTLRKQLKRAVRTIVARS